MKEIARCTALVQQPRRSDTPGPATRLHALARKVEQLAVSGRTDPEAVVIGKLTIASELRTLARELAG